MNKHWLITALLGLFLCNARATSIVCTTLDSTEDQLLSAQKEPLPRGCYARLGTIPANAMSAINPGDISAILTALLPFGEPFTIGEGTNANAGNFEVDVRQPLPQTNNPHGTGTLHLLVVNGPDPHASTELLLLAFSSTTIPADGPGGFPGQLTLKLSEATVVMGSNDPNGKIAMPAASDSITGFATWIHEELGSAEPDKLALTADGDQDGMSNLLEYALLGDVKNAAEDASLAFRFAGTTLTYPDRSDSDPKVQYEVEFCPDLTSGNWQPYTGSTAKDIDLSLPPSFKLASIAIDNTTRLFARIRVRYE